MGNRIDLTNVPDVRCAFRYETLHKEMTVLTELCL
jgi:hypothetical protein